MLASSLPSLPNPVESYLYEVKWDGIRVTLQINEDSIKILSRSGRDITKQFPEMIAAREDLNISVGIFDAEIVCLNVKGLPVFTDVISRMHAGTYSIDVVKKSKPAYCYLFDLMYMDGRHLLKEPLIRRQAWIKDLLKAKTVFRLSDVFEDGISLYHAAEKMNLEGIMAKRRESIYIPGKRSNDWIKIKFRNTIECYIVGFTKGNGDRQEYFGSMQLISKDDLNGKWIYRGRVGSGFDEALLKDLSDHTLHPIVVDTKPIDLKMEEEKNTTWVKPVRICEIQYASITPNETLREPVFLQLRPDLE